MAKKNSLADPNERIYKLLLSIDARISNVEERLTDTATKDNLTYMRNQIDERISEVKLEIRALGRAVDKDALSVMNFGKRIDRLEKKVAIN